MPLIRFVPTGRLKRLPNVKKDGEWGMGNGKKREHEKNIHSLICKSNHLTEQFSTGSSTEDRSTGLSSTCESEAAAEALPPALVALAS